MQVLNFASTLKAQSAKSRDIKQLELKVALAIKKAYPASVLMWAYDTITYTRMSAQFSGVVVSKTGTILSAAHVVMPGKTYQVMFPDGRVCIAKGLGRISIPPAFMLPDAAMMQIVEKGEFPFAGMGYSSALTLNEPCISIAYPESLELRQPNIRFGKVAVVKNKYGFIQSTCLMEPGDSGGPLFDLEGRVIGIHSGIETSEDINYEVPVDTYRKYWTALHKEENYTDLPKDTEVFVQELPLKSPLLKVIDYANSKSAKKFALNCFKVKSLLDGKDQQISATLISTEGVTNKSILISKSSMIYDDPVIQLSNGKTEKAIVLARDIRNDLVILQVDHKIGEGIKLDATGIDSAGINSLGKFLLSPIPGSKSIASVLGSMVFKSSKRSSYGYIGASLNVKNGKSIITVVQPNSAADIAGIKVEDEVIDVSGTTITDALDFLRALSKHWAGDTTLVRIKRAGAIYVNKVVLKYPPQRVANHPAELFAGGKSIRRDGFDGIFTHDARIKPIECGGPVCDTDGHFYGINIARISRTSTAVLPVSIIKQFLLTALKNKPAGK